MSQTYKTRRRAEGPAQGLKTVQLSGPMIGNQPMEALMTGAQTPSSENLGHQVDLPGAIREKMENAFGADLSGVQLYESQAVADAGAQAITMGNKIGFAPGQLDMASNGGQSLLGHELSHVVSQARGEVSGNGFLSDHALEARADREGAMAAAGDNVYSGPVTPLSASSVSGAVGPMQAKKPWKKDKPQQAPAQAPAAPAPAPTMYPSTATTDPHLLEIAQDSAAYNGDSGRMEYLQAEIEHAKNTMDKKDSDKRFKNLNNNSLYKNHLLASLEFAGGRASKNNEKLRHDMFAAFSGDDHQAKASMLSRQIKDINRLFFNPKTETAAGSFHGLDAMDSQSDAAAAGGVENEDENLAVLQSVHGLLNATTDSGDALFTDEQLGLKEGEREAFQLNSQDFLTSAADAKITAKKLAGQATNDPRSLEELRQARYKRRVDRAFRLGDAEALGFYSKDQFMQSGPSKEMDKELDEIHHYSGVKSHIKSLEKKAREEKAKWEAAKKEAEDKGEEFTAPEPQFQLPKAYQDFKKKFRM